MFYDKCFMTKEHTPDFLKLIHNERDRKLQNSDDNSYKNLSNIL